MKTKMFIKGIKHIKSNTICTVKRQSILRTQGDYKSVKSQWSLSLKTVGCCFHAVASSAFPLSNKVISECLIQKVLSSFQDSFLLTVYLL